MVLSGPENPSAPHFVARFLWTTNRNTILSGVIIPRLPRFQAPPPPPRPTRLPGLMARDPLQGPVEVLGRRLALLGGSEVDLQVAHLVLEPLDDPLAAGDLPLQLLVLDLP